MAFLNSWKKVSKMFYNSAQTQYFKDVLLQIAGQALTAAEYALEDSELTQARGLVRFYKSFPTLGENAQLRVGWQLLAFAQSPFARFRVELARLDADNETIKRTLSHVIWHSYEARVLPTEDFWWEFKTSDDLPHTLASAGKLLFAYGIPWLEMQDGIPQNNS